MTIGGLQKTTLIDYPGKVACTVFSAGCNFRCPWCYSSELVLPEKIEKQPRISEKEIFSFLEERKGLLEGVVICGGEPTINQDLLEFISKIKKTGFLVKLDTNGSNPDMLNSLIGQGFVDYVAMDIKGPLEEDSLFRKFNLQLKKSVEILKQGKAEFEFRTTIVPGFHTKNDLFKIAEWIGGENVRYYLQNFRAEKTLDPKLENVKPYPKSYLEEIKEEIKSHFKVCEIRS